MKFKNSISTIATVLLLFQYGLSQSINKSAWKIKLVDAIRLEVIDQVHKGCLKDSSSAIRFYTKELDHFPIELAIDRVRNISTNNNLRKKDFVIIELFYPQVGFDPEYGYQTTIVIKRRGERPEFEEYNIDAKLFESKTGKLKYYKRGMKKDSDCYGTGYIFTTVFNQNQMVRDVNVVLSLE